MLKEKMPAKQRGTKMGQITRRKVRGYAAQPSRVETKTTDKAIRNMRIFYQRVDWHEWWESFFLDQDDKGRFKYSSTRAFAHDRAISPQQRRFIKLLIGPNNVETSLKMATKYPWFGQEPQDWAQKRNAGGWYTKQNMARTLKEIDHRMGVYDKLCTAGDKYYLPEIVRLDMMAESLDKAFHGELFAPNQSFEVNAKRANEYVELKRKLMGLKSTALDLFAKSQGINFADMSGLVNLMTAAAMSAANKAQIEGRVPTKEEAALKAIVSMTMAKAAKYDLPLPHDADTVIIEAVNQNDILTKKKNTN